jgi:hypothetical protein
MEATDAALSKQRLKPPRVQLAAELHANSPPRRSFPNPTPTPMPRENQYEDLTNEMIFSTLAILAPVAGSSTNAKAQDPLPSWNDGFGL